MKALTLVAMMAGMLLFWGFAIALVIWAVFYAFNFVPWNGIRKRPQPLPLPPASPAADASGSEAPASTDTSSRTTPRSA